MHELTRSNPHIDVIWRAFELRPDPVPTLDPRGDYLRRAWAHSVYPMAADFGMTMKLPPVQPRSRLAHQAAQWARTQGRFVEYHAAVFRAFFERGEDIGQIAVLVTLAEGVGLPAKPLRQSLESGAFEQRVLDDEEMARADGINGVPAFVADRKAALSGVQSVEILKQLIDHGRASNG